MKRNNLGKFQTTYTQEQYEWLKKNYSNYTHDELPIAFEKKFGIKKNKDTLRILCQKQLCLKNHKPKINSTRFKKLNKYSQEMDNWIIATNNDYIYNEEHYKAFLEFFNVSSDNYTLGSFQHHRTQDLRLFKDLKKTCMKGVNNSREKNTCNIGYERKHNGYVYIKIKNNKGNAHRNFTAKQRYVWEKANGKIPKGYRLVFLDGNPLNCDITNLALCSESVANSVIKLCYGNGKITEKAIEYLKLESEIEKVIDNAE